MSGIAGYIIFDDFPLQESSQKILQQSIAHRGAFPPNVWADRNTVVCATNSLITPESLHESFPLIDKETGHVLVYDGRIDNRKELIDSLSLNVSASTITTDGDIIMAGYKKWGNSCAAHFVGDFALAIWDNIQQSLFCARDHMGVKPFYYYWDDKIFIFSSEVESILSLLPQQPDLNDRRIYDFIISLYNGEEDTFYKKIYRLPKSSMLSIKNGTLRKARYFDFDPRKTLHLSTNEEYAEAFKEIFTEAVSCRLRSIKPIGTTLSGGLDSSSITCTARNLVRPNGSHKLHSFSAIFPSLSGKDKQRVDERKYMDAVISQGGFHPHFIEADKFNPIDFSLIHTKAEPMAAYNGYIHDAMWAKAEELGVGVFLDGIDGDTTVSYGYERLWLLGRTLKWPTLFRETSLLGELQNCPFSRKRCIKEFILSPCKTQIQEALKQVLKTTTPPPPLFSKLLQPDFLKQFRNQDIHQEIQSTHPTMMHYRAITSGLWPYVMEIIDTITSSRPFECRFPFWDRRLMQFCLSLPYEQKLFAGVTRRILRQGMRNVLPENIRQRHTKAKLDPHFNNYLSKHGRAPLTQLPTEAVERYLNKDNILEYFKQKSPRHHSVKDYLLLYRILALSNWLR